MTKKPTGSYRVKHWSKHPDFADLPWSPGQIRLFVKDVRQETRGCWDEWLTPRVRNALIAEAAFNIARAQHRDSIQVVAMDRLLEAMRIEAGLREPPEGYSV